MFTMSSAPPDKTPRFYSVSFPDDSQFTSAKELNDIHVRKKLKVTGDTILEGNVTIKKTLHVENVDVASFQDINANQIEVDNLLAENATFAGSTNFASPIHLVSQVATSRAVNASFYNFLDINQATATQGARIYNSGNAMFYDVNSVNFSDTAQIFKIRRAGGEFTPFSFGTKINMALNLDFVSSDFTYRNINNLYSMAIKDTTALGKYMITLNENGNHLDINHNDGATVDNLLRFKYDHANIDCNTNINMTSANQNNRNITNLNSLSVLDTQGTYEIRKSTTADHLQVNRIIAGNPTTMMEFNSNGAIVDCKRTLQMTTSGTRIEQPIISITENSNQMKRTSIRSNGVNPTTGTAFPTLEVIDIQQPQTIDGVNYPALNRTISIIPNIGGGLLNPFVRLNDSAFIGISTKDMSNLTLTTWSSHHHGIRIEGLSPTTSKVSMVSGANAIEVNPTAMILSGSVQMANGQITIGGLNNLSMNNSKIIQSNASVIEQSGTGVNLLKDTTITGTETINNGSLLLNGNGVITQQITGGSEYNLFKKSMFGNNISIASDGITCTESANLYQNVYSIIQQTGSGTNTLKNTTINGLLIVSGVISQTATGTNTLKNTIINGSLTVNTANLTVNDANLSITGVGVISQTGTGTNTLKNTTIAGDFTIDRYRFSQNGGNPVYSTSIPTGLKFTSGITRNITNGISIPTTGYYIFYWSIGFESKNTNCTLYDIMITLSASDVAETRTVQPTQRYDGMVIIINHPHFVSQSQPLYVVGGGFITLRAKVGYTAAGSGEIHVVPTASSAPCSEFYCLRIA